VQFVAERSNFIMMLILETDMILKILKHLQKSSQNDANNYDRFYQK
jgi:hypothetical protein